MIVMKKENDDISTKRKKDKKICLEKGARSKIKENEEKIFF